MMLLGLAVAARLDRLFYSPLCLIIGAGFFTLGIRGFSA